MRISIKILHMLRFGLSVLLTFSIVGWMVQSLQGQAFATHSLAELVLLLPPQIISGERATLAVLDANGRLASGVTVTFSNGDRVTTDNTGRALFVAPLDGTEILASISGRHGRAKTTIRAAAEAPSATLEVFTAPRLVAAGDRFELSGQGFCGDADANHVLIAGQRALVLASSPLTLTIATPPDVAPGRARVELTCARDAATPFFITLIDLELRADSSPLKPGEHRSLSVRIKGTTSRVSIEATNLAPHVAELVGGNSVVAKSSGGSQNTARFELTGKNKGSFRLAIRLAPMIWRLPRPGIVGQVKVLEFLNKSGP
jgi:hypothetical protein